MAKKRIIRVENGKAYEYKKKRGSGRSHNRRKLSLCFVDMGTRVQCAERKGSGKLTFLSNAICDKVSWGRMAECSSGQMYHHGRSKR